jgi:predicted transposase/invertase (TIGR01784 family)
LYLLSEQQEKPQKMMAFRMLRYLFSIIQQHINQGNTSLPLIYGIVVYTGKRSPYPYSTDVFDLFENKDLAKEILYQPFQLVDLGQLSDANLNKNRLASIMLRLLKNKGTPEILSLIIDMKSAGLFEMAENLGLYDYLLGMIEYIIDQTETQQDAEKAVDVLIEALPNEREKIMTIAEKLKIQGRREGLEKGLHQGLEKGAEKEKRLTAKRMLKGGLADKQIIEYAKVSLKLLNELKKELEKSKK